MIYFSLQLLLKKGLIFFYMDVSDVHLIIDHSKNHQMRAWKPFEMFLQFEIFLWPGFFLLYWSFEQF